MGHILDPYTNDLLLHLAQRSTALGVDFLLELLSIFSGVEVRRVPWPLQNLYPLVLKPLFHFVDHMAGNLVMHKVRCVVHFAHRKHVVR